MLVSITWIGPSLKHFDSKDRGTSAEPTLESLKKERENAGDTRADTCLKRFADETRHWTGYVVTHLGELVYLYG